MYNAILTFKTMMLGGLTYYGAVLSWCGEILHQTPWRTEMTRARFDALEWARWKGVTCK